MIKVGSREGTVRSSQVHVVRLVCVLVVVYNHPNKVKCKAYFFYKNGDKNYAAHSYSQEQIGSKLAHSDLLLESATPV